MDTKKLTLSALLIAIGTLTAHILYIPVGVAKCFPIQHAINILSAVILGPWYAVANAFLTSLVRNILGTGSLLAFPGSMIGALLAGILYKKTGIDIFRF
jgi:energy coupling factor transporter S component ThiW